MRRLFFFVLSRGILVTVVQLVSLIAYVTVPSQLYWQVSRLRF